MHVDYISSKWGMYFIQYVLNLMFWFVFSVCFVFFWISIWWVKDFLTWLNVSLFVCCCALKRKKKNTLFVRQSSMAWNMLHGLNDQEITPPTPQKTPVFNRQCVLRFSIKQQICKQWTYSTKRLTIGLHTRSSAFFWELLNTSHDLHWHIGSLCACYRACMKSWRCTDHWPLHKPHLFMETKRWDQKLWNQKASEWYRGEERVRGS